MAKKQMKDAQSSYKMNRFWGSNIHHGDYS